MKHILEVRYSVLSKIPVKGEFGGSGQTVGFSFFLILPSTVSTTSLSFIAFVKQNRISMTIDNSLFVFKVLFVKKG